MWELLRMSNVATLFWRAIRSTGARLALALTGTVIILWMAAITAGELVHASKNVHWGLLAASIGLGAAFTYLISVVFAINALQEGVEEKKRSLIAAFLISQPGKYLPGKVWSAVMQITALGRKQSIVPIGLANVRTMVFVVLQMTVLGLACWAWSISVVLAVSMLSTCVMLCMLVICAPISSATWLMRWLPTWTQGRTSTASREARLNTAEALKLSTAAAMANLAASVALISATAPALSFSDVLALLASIYLGFAAGIAVVIVPAALGVREAATVGFALQISPNVPAETVIVVVLFARAWQIALDALSAACGWLLFRQD